jgi:glycerol-3-phosphate dehydrogenase
MQRASISALAATPVDVLVIGGGIYGAMAAREAALRGLSTALVEQGDWGAGTSYNSLKVVHGGIRYVQHLDVARLRSSARERAFWQAAAPDLVAPLDFVIPLVGHGIKGPEAFAAAAALYTALSAGVCGPGYGGTGVIGRAEARRRLGDLAPEGLTGGGVWRDGQIRDANRLEFACLTAASEAGAALANYMEAVELLHHEGRVLGARLTDRTTGESAEVRAGVTLSCTGAHAAGLAAPVVGEQAAARFPAFARALNLVIDRPFGPSALGAISRSRADAVVDRGGRMYFLTPWEGKLVIGTHESPHPGGPWTPDPWELTADGAEFLDEMNHACPALALRPEEVILSYGGLIPADVDDARGTPRRQTRGTLIDHLAADGVAGLISSVGVKYTTARLIAERMVGLAQAQLDRGRPAEEGARLSFETPLPQVDLAALDPDDPSALAARIGRAMDAEMALSLEDVLFRRSRLAETGAFRGPEGDARRAAAEVAAAEAGLPLAPPLAGGAHAVA